jgi:hypothetical protein
MEPPIEVEKRTRAVLYIARMIENYMMSRPIPLSLAYTGTNVAMFRNIS